MTTSHPGFVCRVTSLCTCGTEHGGSNNHPFLCGQSCCCPSIHYLLLIWVQAAPMPRPPSAGSAPFRTFPEHLILLHPGQIPTPPQPTPAGVVMVLQVPAECLSSSPLDFSLSVTAQSSGSQVRVRTANQSTASLSRSASTDRRVVCVATDATVIDL